MPATTAAKVQKPINLQLKGTITGGVFSFPVGQLSKYMGTATTAGKSTGKRGRPVGSTKALKATA